jgi:FtsP/CotA-like multicopper oxidase with cupredoxin domain
MKQQECRMVRGTRALRLVTLVLFGAAMAEAQTAKAGKIDPAWLRADAAAKTVDFKLVAGLTDMNGGMNFNGFGRGGLVLTVPVGWNVVVHFKNEDPNLPHSAEVIAEANPLPIGAVPPAFDGATSGQLDQGVGAGQGRDMRFVAGKAGSFLIFCAVPGHGAAGMWTRLTVSAAADQPALTTAPEH